MRPAEAHRPQHPVGGAAGRRPRAQRRRDGVRHHHAMRAGADAAWNAARSRCTAAASGRRRRGRGRCCRGRCQGPEVLEAARRAAGSEAAQGGAAPADAHGVDPVAPRAHEAPRLGDVGDGRQVDVDAEPVERAAESPERAPRDRRRAAPEFRRGGRPSAGSRRTTPPSWSTMRIGRTRLPAATMRWRTPAPPSPSWCANSTRPAGSRRSTARVARGRCRDADDDGAGRHDGRRRGEGRGHEHGREGSGGRAAGSRESARLRGSRAYSSVVERSPHTREVPGSNPGTPIGRVASRAVSRSTSF